GGTRAVRVRRSRRECPPRDRRTSESSSASPFVVAVQRNVTELRYAVPMGRPRQHDEQTAAQLLEAAERIVDQDGIAALSVRRLATAVGTTTGGVYSLFGSKEGLVVALGARAFELLEAGIEALPETADPQADLVEAGVKVFRRFAVDHPSLFELAVQRS